MKLVTLDYENKEVHEPIKYFLDPNFVYIPLPDKKEKLKKEKEIKKENLFYDGIYAPISGELVGLEKCITPKGVGINCLVLANDFQEKVSKTIATRKKINSLSKEEVLDSVFSIALKRKMKYQNVTTILVSGIDDEPYFVNESFVQRENTKAILETLDALLHIYPNSKAIIAVKNTDISTIMAYNSILGTYKNIFLKMIPNLYLIGKEEFLTKYTHIRKNYLYLTANEVYNLYTNIKKRKPVTEKYVKISGNAVSNHFVIRTKYGVKVKEILDRFYKEDLAKCTLFINGVMHGKVMDLEKTIVTFDFEGIAIMKENKQKIKDCIKCGKCISICPINSNPLLSYKRSKKVRCIDCGLCSYICPSYIPLQKYLSGDKNESIT